MTTPCVAIPFEAWPPEKLATIVTKCCQHKPWFSQRDWDLGEPHRRTLVLGRLSDAHSKSWEVYKGSELVGLLTADEIVPHQDARTHVIFFDRELRDKRQMVINTMAWLFNCYHLHALRTEIPTYAAKLLGFVRKALGFRFESEQRIFSWPASSAPLSADVAKLGSRLHQAVLHEGVWHDLLLLSITRNEFEDMVKDKVDRPIRQAVASERT